MHKGRPIVVVATLVAMLALAGCGQSAPKSSAAPAPNPTSTTSKALASLAPDYPHKLTEDTAKAETVRLADAIQGLIAKPDIVHVDNTSKLVAATKSDAAYWGVLRVVTATTDFDAIAQATAMEQLLVSAGWVERQTSTPTDSYAALLSSTHDGDVSLLLLRADAAPKSPPAVLIQLESPDLPK